MPQTIRTIAKHVVIEMIIHLLEEITKLPERCRRTTKVETFVVALVAN
jgi:hypothetical protein